MKEDHEKGVIDDNPFFKPGVREEIEDTSVLSDFQRALKEQDKDKVMELVQQRRLHTYDEALKEKGIERESDWYRHCFGYAISWLYENRPFYAYMFAEIVRRETLEIDTLCVTIRSGRIEMWYNPDFMALHTLMENVGFLQHEMGHVAHEHLPMQKKLDRKTVMDPVFGLAIDLAVDSLIQGKGIQPDWVLLPSKLRIPDKEKPESEWPSFLERKSWEYYFKLLQRMRDENQEEFEKQMEQGGRPQPCSGQPGGDQEGGGEGEDKEDGDGDEEDGEGEGKGEPNKDGKGKPTQPGPGKNPFDGGMPDLPGQRNPYTKDDHRPWDLEEMDSAEIQQEVIKHTVKQAYNKADNHADSDMRGYMAPELLDRIQEMMKTKSVPFQTIFRTLVARHIKVGRRPTMIKLSRRRKCPPGNTFQRSLKILWAQDDSGSVRPEERALCRSELWHANQSTNVTIHFQRFTYGLAGPLLNLDEVPFKKALEEYDGGTDFQAVCDLADELDVDLLLIGTDGHAPTPRKPRTPVGWILTHDGKEHEWGMIIRMPSVADIKSGHKAVVERWLK
jgi:predicted metal-dependent peptidase